MRLDPVVFLALLLSFAPMATEAQSPVGPAVAPGGGEPRSLCFRGRPRTRCRAFTVTEFTFLGLKLHDETRGYAQMDMGAMYNLSDRTAVGASLTMRDVDASGATLRFRYWVEEGAAVDVSVGWLGGDADDGERGPFGSGVSLRILDLIGPVAQYERTPDGAAFGGGARFGSWAGLALGVLFVSLVAIGGAGS